ncbi:MAG: leucine-rich repeat protein [Clostridia bacterium]|nr:leucine-rich repeat protein [Clostridia bacterium]
MNYREIKRWSLLFLAVTMVTLFGVMYRPSLDNSVADGGSSGFSDIESGFSTSTSSTLENSTPNDSSQSSILNENSSSLEESASSSEEKDSSKSSDEESSSMEDSSSNSSSENSSSQTTMPHIHRYQMEVLRIPSCTMEGITQYTCACGEYYTETISKKEHNEAIDEAVAPTCVKTGLSEGLHCSTCDEVFVKQEVLPMVEHTYKEGYCQVCDLVGLEFTVNMMEGYAICTKIVGNVARRVVIPDTYYGYPVRELAPSLFEGHSELYSVEIGKNVAVIGEGAFQLCYHLVEVYDRSDAQVSKYPDTQNGALMTFVEDDDVHYQPFTSKIEIINECVIFHDEGENILLDYQGAGRTVTIPEGVTAIDSYAFLGKTSVREVILPKTLKYIARYAFLHCDLIESILFLSPDDWWGKRKEDNQWVEVSPDHLKTGKQGRDALVELYFDYDFKREKEV